MANKYPYDRQRLSGMHVTLSGQIFVAKRTAGIIIAPSVTFQSGNDVMTSLQITTTRTGWGIILTNSHLPSLCSGHEQAPKHLSYSIKVPPVIRLTAIARR